MKVADYVKPGVVEFRADASRPRPERGQVLVAVKSCGICGSDIHMFRNGALADRIVRSTPEGYKVPGHELAGVIAELGQDVDGWSVGDRIVAIPSPGGGMAEYMTVPVNPYQIARMPEGVDFDEAATTEPMADALQMVRKAAVQPGEHVVVFGVGIIGLGVIQALKAKGVSTGSIIAIDVHQSRLDKAIEVGATAAIDSREGNMLERVAQITMGGVQTGFQGEHANVGVVFDCAGYSENFGSSVPLEDALTFAAPNVGRIICFGSFGDKPTLDLHPIVRKQVTVMGSYGYLPEELAEALELMRSGRVNRRSLISHNVPLEQVSKAFATQMQPEAVKVMIKVSES